MASQRASITKELLRKSLDSVLKPFQNYSLDRWFWNAISGVKYQTLLSCPFSQGAMRRVCIIRLIHNWRPFATGPGLKLCIFPTLKFTTPYFNVHLY